MCIATVGTVRTFGSCFTMMTTSAVPPAYSPLGVPVTATVTGKVALPPEEEVATIPTELTTPDTVVLLSVGVALTCRPGRTCARSASPISASNTQLPVEMTTT